MTFLIKLISQHKKHTLSIILHMNTSITWYTIKEMKVTWQKMKQTPFYQYQVVGKYNQDVCSIIKEVQKLFQ